MQRCGAEQGSKKQESMTGVQRPEIARDQELGQARVPHRLNEHGSRQGAVPRSRLVSRQQIRICFTDLYSQNHQSIQEKETGGKWQRGKVVSGGGDTLGDNETKRKAVRAQMTALRG